MRSFYYADANGDPVGPVTADDLKALHQSGAITSTTLVTDADHEKWRPLYEHELTDAGAPNEPDSPSNCPSCGESIKVGLFSANSLLPAWQMELINEYSRERLPHCCERCGPERFAKAKEKLIADRDNLTREMQDALALMPILTIHTPLHWDYTVCGLVTAQSTTGTGVFSEVAATFTDFVGAQSHAYNEKIKAGEDRCKSLLRGDALKIGGNAVIAVDVDYAEIGTSRGMLMVSMTGTAVLLRNPDVVGTDVAQSLERINHLRERLSTLEKFRV